MKASKYALLKSMKSRQCTGNFLFLVRKSHHVFDFEKFFKGCLNHFQIVYHVCTPPGVEKVVIGWCKMLYETTM